MSTSPDLKRRNRRTLWILSAITLGMFGFGFALVPLYGLICDLTGVQSVERRIASNSTQPQMSGGQDIVLDRWVTVKFNATVHPQLPWRFRPLQSKVRIHPGAVQEVMFVAENRSSSSVTGQALPSIAPWQATDFFSKLECFCFNRQTLEGGETKEMPLRFMVSRDLPEGIDSLTLSYNFMRLEETNKETLAAN